jgi:hypothetical protein
VAVRHSRAVQRLSSATRPTESRLGRIGPISLDVKQMGERSAGNPHAAFDAEGAGNVAGSKCFDPSRRASPRPYLGAPGGESLNCTPFGLLSRGSAGSFRLRRGYGRSGGPVYGLRITAGERAALILVCPPV